MYADGKINNFQFIMFDFQKNFNFSTCKTLLFLLTIISAWPTAVLASEKIDVFETGITVNEDASIDVEEKIVYDFGNTKRHGIYREIPYKYKARGGNYVLKIDGVAVTDEAGNTYKFRSIKEGSRLKIRVGDPDKHVTGRRVYMISYSVNGAINFFDDYGELYWNVTGDEWEVPINKASAIIALPLGVSLDQVKIGCFAGKVGSNELCSGPKGNNYTKEDELQRVFAKFEHAKLAAGEGMTTVVGLPKGVIREPTLVEKLGRITRDNWVVVVPILTVVVLFYVWLTHGRDPKGRGTIMPQYSPPAGLSPSQVGTIIDERADRVDISADIVYMAVGGYLKIRRLEVKRFLGKKVDYELVRLKGADSNLSKPESELFSKLFEKNTETVKISDLKNRFYKDWAKVRSIVYKSMVENNYFPKNPARVRTAYAVIGIFLLGAGGILSFFFGGVIGAVSMAVSGLVVALFGMVMPVKTRKGAIMKEYILGLKMYLSVAEKERLKFHNAPEKNPELFDKLLPFAMALKVEKEWAKQFEDIYKEPPRWYEGPAGTHFNSALLVSNIGDFSTAAQKNLSSSPSSAAHGGSGFSGGGVGGGFGGGGGGSW